MEDLIKALQIFSKYSQDHNPTNCEHDVFSVCVHPRLISKEDVKELKKLSFFVNDSDGFSSYRFGSC